LTPLELEANLSSLNCGRCRGNWVPGFTYWTWLEQHGPNLPERLEPTEEGRDADSQEMKLCPECKSLMFQYKVGRGLAFYLDQCARCKGIWFDRDEWEALKRRNLHDDVHAIFTAPWQAGASKEERVRRLDQMYADRLGADEYAEVKRFRAWLDAHPRRQEMLAFLTDRDPFDI
jgi:Zn-finger nucleic acid-binding protein